MNTGIRVLILIAVLLVVGYIFRDILGMEKFYCKVFGAEPKTPGKGCVDKEIVDTGPGAATIGREPADIGDGSTIPDPPPRQPDPVLIRGLTAYADGPFCRRIFTQGVTYQPTGWNWATGRLFTPIEPGANTGTGIALTSVSITSLLDCGAGDLTRPFTIYRGTRAHPADLPWTVWNPIVTDPTDHDREYRGTAALMTLLLARSMIAELSGGPSVRAVDSTLPPWYPVRQATQYMCAFADSIPWNTLRDFAYASDMLEMGFMGLGAWMRNFARELGSGGNATDGISDRPQSWGKVATGNKVQSAIAGTPRGPWRTGLRIALYELFAGSIPPYSSSEAIRRIPGIPSIQQGIAALDAVFLDMWSLSYTDVRHSLYQYWPQLLGSNRVETYNQIALATSRAMEGSFLQLTESQRLIAAIQMMRWLILPSYDVEYGACP